MKKVLEVAPAIWPAYSIGGPVMTEKLFRRAISSSSHLTVVSTNLGFEKLKFCEAKKKILNENESKIVVHRIFGPANFSFSFAQAIWLIANIRKYDVVINQGIWNFPFLLSSLLSVFLNKKLIIFPHGNLTFDTIMLKSHRLKSILLKFYKIFLSENTIVVSNTQVEREDVEVILGVTLDHRVIPNFVDVEKCIQVRSERKLSTISKRVELVHFGRVTPKKRLDLTIKLVSLLKERGVKVHLHIIGPVEQEYKSILLEQINKLSVKEDISWLGLLDHADGLRLLSQMDFFVLLSQNENFGVAPVEALAVGTPVIVSDRVGVCELVSDSKNVYIFNFDKLIVGDNNEFNNILNILCSGDAIHVVNDDKMLTEKFSSNQISFQYRELIDNEA